MKRLLMIILSGIFIALACYSVYQVLKVDETKLKVKGQSHYINGKSIGSEMVTGLNGKKIKLSSKLNNDINIINIWASWCEPCNKEMPELVNYDKQKPNHVSLLGMNIQDKREDRVAFIQKYKAEYPMVVDDDAFIKKYKIIVIPTTLFVDKNGKVMGTYMGELDEEKLKTLIKEY